VGFHHKWNAFGFIPVHQAGLVPNDRVLVLWKNTLSGQESRGLPNRRSRLSKAAKRGDDAQSARASMCARTSSAVTESPMKSGELDSTRHPLKGQHGPWGKSGDSTQESGSTVHGIFEVVEHEGKFAQLLPLADCCMQGEALYIYIYIYILDRT
jgi:hypothetical protein